MRRFPDRHWRFVAPHKLFFVAKALVFATDVLLGVKTYRRNKVHQHQYFSN